MDPVAVVDQVFLLIGLRWAYGPAHQLDLKALHQLLHGQMNFFLPTDQESPVLSTLSS